MPIRLAIFDVDGVIKESPDPYTFLHRHFGTEEAGARYLQAFLAGEITYVEFAQLDAGEWKGRTVAEIKAILRTNPYMPGAHALAEGLRIREIPFLLLSSGFDLHVEDIAADLNVDEYLCNSLNHDGEHLTGTMTVRVPWGGKVPMVKAMLRRWQVEPGDCLVVGDSTADVPTFHAAGHAVAVRPSKPEVSQAAHLTLPDLHGLLDFIDAIS